MNHSQMLLNAASDYARMVIREILILRGFDTIELTQEAVDDAVQTMVRQSHHYVDGFDNCRPAATTAALIIEDDLKNAN